MPVMQKRKHHQDRLRYDGSAGRRGNVMILMIRFRHATLALSLYSLALVAGAWRPAWSQQQHPAYGAIRPAAVPLPPPNPSTATNPTPVAKPAPAAKPAVGICHPETFRVVVDVGHTAAVPGAMSARGATEYSFNLALAQDAKQALVDAGFAKTELLITDKPPPQGLMVRAAEANRLPADLFLSIHHDSVPDDLLKAWQYEGQDQHYNDDYPGYALFISNDNGDHLGSLLFGGFLGKELQARGLQYTPHYTLALMGHRRRELLDPVAGVYRYDALIVLRMTRMPALLLEAGSIVNRQEELDLGAPDRRGRTSAAIVAAVADFCAARARPVAAKPMVQPAAPKSIGTRASTITPAR
jgi:N-acetylmuramoyl-L-alanine amidase